jgi:hypothetical protein
MSFHSSLQLKEMPLITRDCTLAWDEASIQPKYEMLPSGDWCGLSTVPSTRKVVTYIMNLNSVITMMMKVFAQRMSMTMKVE